MRFFLLMMCLAMTTAGFAAASPDVVESMERSVRPTLVIRGEHRPPVSLAQRMEQLKVRAVSIAVVRDGKLAWARAYGYADREWKIPATPDTLFQAGSISKPITALAALRGVDAGTLDLDRNVNDYLKSWQLPDNEFTAVRKVTVRNILNHTAGLTVWGFPGYTRAAGMPSIVDVLDGKGNTPPIRVWKQPDQSWRYSGGGYTILQLLLSDQSGMPFPVLMRDTVLKLLGMNHSTYEQPLPRALRALAAAGYETEDFDVARKDGFLVMTYNGEKVSTLLPESDRKFFDSDSGMPVEFLLEDKAATIVIGGWGRGVRHDRD